MESIIDGFLYFSRILVSRQIPNFILLSTFIVISILCLIFLKKSQDDLLPHYHDFADKEIFWGYQTFSMFRQMDSLSYLG